jgi:hypothetical protein
MLPAHVPSEGKMNRRNRLALLAAVAVILAASGTVLAIRSPGGSGEPAGVTQDEEAPPTEEGPPTAEDLAHAADRLRAKGFTVDDAVLSDLAAAYGVGGAVRLIAWSSDPDVGMTIDELRAMRDGDGTEGSGMGWGRIAKELGVHPGIGSIMGNGGGHGRENAPGQAKKSESGDASGD